MRVLLDQIRCLCVTVDFLRKVPWQPSPGGPVAGVLAVIGSPATGLLAAWGQGCSTVASGRPSSSTSHAPQVQRR
jgi:hypothetical protein